MSKLLPRFIANNVKDGSESDFPMAWKQPEVVRKRNNKSIKSNITDI